jgi:hypothetical protein
MEWCDANGTDYIFGLPGNAVLDRRTRRNSSPNLHPGRDDRASGRNTG